MATVRIALADLPRASLPTRSLSGGDDAVVVAVRPVRLRPGAPVVRLPFDRRMLGRLAWYALIVRVNAMVFVPLALLVMAVCFLLGVTGYYPMSRMGSLAWMAQAPAVVGNAIGLCWRVQPYPQLSRHGVVVIQGVNDSVAAEWHELAGEIVAVGA
jgi:hypothetical protein